VTVAQRACRAAPPRGVYTVGLNAGGCRSAGSRSPARPCPRQRGSWFNRYGSSVLRWRRLAKSIPCRTRADLGRDQRWGRPPGPVRRPSAPRLPDPSPRPPVWLVSDAAFSRVAASAACALTSHWRARSSRALVSATWRASDRSCFGGSACCDRGAGIPDGDPGRGDSGWGDRGAGIPDGDPGRGDSGWGDRDTGDPDGDPGRGDSGCRDSG